MSEVVLDASVVLAAVGEEAGHEAIYSHATPLISAVNYAEVHARLAARGFDRQAAQASLALFDLDVVDFTAEQALASAELRPATRAAGLSLGDRACLALARSRKATALTADRAWNRTELDIEIEFIR